MKVYKYSWTRIYGVDAQVAGEIFQKCKNDATIVAEAADPDHPLHNQFLWDDSEAARHYRIWQARQIRCSLTVEVITKDKEVRNIRAFIRTIDKVGYVPTLEADDDELGAAEQKCWLQMKAFRARWNGFRFAREVIQAISAKELAMNRKRKKKAA